MSSPRAYYAASISDFLQQSNSEILGRLSQRSEFDDTLSQKSAWVEIITILKSGLHDIPNAHVILEYTIPRMGRRVDAIVLLDRAVAVIEFKVGSSDFSRSDINQVVDYALDLKYFHAGSESVVVVPILVATEASQSIRSRYRLDHDGVATELCVAPAQLGLHLSNLAMLVGESKINHEDWIASAYRPTPTIVEAAQVLFREHTVDNISRNDASAINLERTTATIGRVIDNAKSTGTKHVCLVTGVPGAGKTLAGLAIANSRQRFEDEEHAVFLSGNGPLVTVLQEALARDQFARGLSRTKSESLRRSKAFIQAIHHFRDDAVSHDSPPHEKVTIFDEAQRAWDAVKLSKFMKTKRGLSGFDQSEPEFLLGVMDRHQDWSVVVCLVGEGQEIHTGEAGISAWLSALEHEFFKWHVHTSPRIHADAYARGVNVKKLFDRLGTERVHYDDSLHLNVSIRSFRSEKLSSFVEAVLKNEPLEAKILFEAFSDVYPIVLTRSLENARSWVRTQARGSERYGLVASSGGKRLRPHGIWVDYRNSPIEWFLNDDSDVRSSFGLEITATEFDVQGLEIDWAIVAWDADLRHNGQDFEHWAFRGAKWESVVHSERRLYLSNAYRVLLTRARQGFVIYVPHGDGLDSTRSGDFYDHTYSYLKNIGIREI